ncbi:hypothetical protein GGC47_001046 [Bosea sp. OAE752]|uniref:hypothetical protein n=1 Tax=Bosea sp. OAE752 TaxID=2663873 RepID=UPI003D2024FA
MPLLIDLQAPTIAQERRVWRLFPGNGYQFLPTFMNERVAFLDLPGFPMPAQPIQQANDVIARLAFSQALRNELYEKGADHHSQLSLAEFSGARRTKTRGRIRQAIVNLLTEARSGDLVVVPSTLSDGEINIGRFRGEDVTEAFYYRKYGENPLQARHVDWIARVDEGSISSDFRRTLRHQHPFALVERQYWIEVLSLAYNTFVFRDMHVSTVFNQGDYTDAHASFLGNVTKLASAAVEALEEGRELDPAHLLDLLLSTPPAEFTASQQADIHSPGFNRYVSATIVALVSAALVAAFMALPTDRAQLAVAMSEMTVINSSPDADPQCTAKVHAAQKLVIEMLDVDKTLKMCEAARKAQARGNLRSSASTNR